MGQQIWAVLEEYAGQWVAVDGSGRVIDHAASLPDLTERANGAAERRTILFAAQRGTPPRS